MDVIHGSAFSWSSSPRNHKFLRNPNNVDYYSLRTLNNMNIIVCIRTEASPGVLQCITHIMGTQLSQGKHEKSSSLFSHFFLFPLISMCFQTVTGFQDTYSHSRAHAGCVVTGGVLAAAQHLCQKVRPFLTLKVVMIRNSWDFLVIKTFLSFHRYVYIDLWIFIHKNKDVHLLLQPQLMEQNRNIHQRERAGGKAKKT